MDFQDLLDTTGVPRCGWDWYVYLHEWLKFMINVGKYTICGAYGVYIPGSQADY